METPDGPKSGSSVMSVHPDRGYQQGGTTQTKGDAIVVDLGGDKALVALMAHLENGVAEPEGINYVAVRAFSAAGQRAVFRQMDRLKGSVPVTAELDPGLKLMDGFAPIAAFTRD